jgi:hypothetical protein
MNLCKNRRSTASRSLALLLLPLLAGPLLAADKPVPANAPGAYQRDQARCMKMPIHGERAECLSEASTAQAARQPVRPDADPGRYARNALERCKPLSEPDRGDCLARMSGRGTTSGSVAGGGIYRELVTQEPAAAPAGK